MADDSEAVEVVQENANPIPAILGSGLNWGDHICVSVLLPQDRFFLPDRLEGPPLYGSPCRTPWNGPPQAQAGCGHCHRRAAAAPFLPRCSVATSPGSGSFRRKSVLDILSGSKTRSRVLGRGAAGDILDELA
jgi:hypothetical protein